MGFIDIIKQGLGITSAQKALQTAGQYLPRQVTEPVIRAEQVLRNPPMLKLPRYEAPSYLPSTVRYMADLLHPQNLGGAIAEQFINTPSLLTKGVMDTSQNLSDQFRWKERVPLTKYVKDVAPFAEGMLNIATGTYGGSILKSAAKNAMKPVAAKSFKTIMTDVLKGGAKMAGEGAGIGASYGALSGIEEAPTDDPRVMIDTILEGIKRGGTAGAIAGPVVGATLKTTGKMFGRGKAQYDTMTPAERQAGGIEIPSMKDFLSRSKKTLQPKEYPVEKPSVPYEPSGKVQLPENTRVTVDTIHRALSKQGERTFDKTKVVPALEYYARNLGDKEMNRIYTETLKYPKEKSIVRFWDGLKTKTKEMGIADFDEWQRAVATQEAPAPKKTVSGMLKPVEQPVYKGTDIAPSPKKTVAGILRGQKQAQDGYGSIPPASQPPKPPKTKGKRYLTPEQLTKEEQLVKSHLENWAAHKKQGEAAGTAIASRFVDTPEALRDEIIQAREKTVANPSPEAREIGGEIGKVFDQLHDVAKKHGMDIQFKKDFFTHIWSDDSIERLVRDKVMGRSVSGDPYFLKGQSITWKQGLDMGLKPKYRTVQEVVESYSQRLYKALANRKLIERLKADDLAFDSQEGTQYKPVSILGYENAIDGSNVVYLTNKSADLMSKVFNPKVATAPWEKALEKTAKIGKGMTQMILSGGYRDINAMGLGKLLFKELPSGNFKAVKRFVQAAFPSGEKKIFQDIAKDVMKYQGWGIDIHVGKENIVDAISNKNLKRTIPEKLVKIFKDNMESPTFDYFIPAAQVDFARSIEKQAIKQGLKEEAVRQVVKTAMKRKYDVGSSLTTMLQNRNLQNALDTVFFAKSLRKSTIMSNLVGNVQALRNPLALENQGNIRGMIGGLVALSTLNAINKASTGRNMWENPDGWNYAYIKYGENEKGEDKYFRLNTTSIEYTWLKQLTEMVKGVVSGDGKKVAQTAKQTLQFGLKTIVDLVTNTDWKMDKIWNPSDSMTDKLKKMGTNTLNQNIHPAAKGILTFFQKPDAEQRWENLIGDIGEIPGEFKTEKQYKTANYFKSEQEVLGRLSPEDRKVYEEMKQKGETFEDKQRDKVADAYMILNHPEVMKAQRDIAIMTAKKNNQAVDPLWLLSDAELKKYYTIQGLTNNGDAQKAMKEEEASWWEPLKTARGAFFDELQASGAMKEVENEYPEPNESIQKKLDTYYSFPKGTGQRTAFANANPDLKEYWNQVSEYYDRVRGAFGLGPAPAFGSSSGGSSSYGPNSQYEKNRWSNIRSKNKSRITKSINAMLKKPKKQSASKPITIKTPKMPKRKSIKAMLVKKPKYPKFSYKFMGKTVS